MLAENADDGGDRLALVWSSTNKLIFRLWSTERRTA